MGLKPQSQTVEPPQSKNYFPAITAFRILIALLIFLYHWASIDAEQWLLPFRAFVREGYFRVDAMMALSGFVLTVRYGQPVSQNLMKPREFWLKRFLRIYPEFALVMFAFVIVPGRPLNQDPNNLTSALAIFALLQSFVPSLAFSGTSTSWSLINDFIFASIFAWLIHAFFARISLRRILLYVAVVTLMCLLSTVVLSRAPDIPDLFVGEPLDFLLRYFPLSRLPVYLFGMTAGIAFVRSQTQPAQKKRWQALLLPLGVLWCMSVISAEWASSIMSPILERTAGLISTAIGSLWMISLAHYDSRAARFGKLVDNRIIAWLGALTFPLYLIQMTEPAQEIYWIFLNPFPEDGLLRATLLLIYLLPLCYFVNLVSKWIVSSVLRLFYRRCQNDA